MPVMFTSEVELTVMPAGGQRGTGDDYVLAFFFVLFCLFLFFFFFFSPLKQFHEMRVETQKTCWKN